MGQSVPKIIVAVLVILVGLALVYWQLSRQPGGAGISLGGNPLVVSDVYEPSKKKRGFSTVRVIGNPSGDAEDDGYFDQEGNALFPLDGDPTAEVDLGPTEYDFLRQGDKIKKINGIEVKNAREAYLVMKALNQPSAPVIVFEVSRIGLGGKSITQETTLSRDLLGTLELKGAGGKKVDTSFEPTCQHLLWAAQDGNAVSAEQILKQGQKKCLDRQYPEEYKKGQTALIASVESENLGVARLLLKYGADVNITDTNGTTPLMRAAELGNRELVVLLLAEGADTGARNNEMRSASDIAASQGFRDIAKVIESPSPNAFLPSDQRVKVPSLLAKQNLINPKHKYHSDAELSKAIKEWQLKKGLAPTGMLTRDQFDKLRRDSHRFASKYSDAREERETVSTLRRMDSRFFKRNWSVVDTRFGISECEKETVLFELSADGSMITMKTYRPGASIADLEINGVKPNRVASYEVEKATIEKDRDIILVKNTATGLSTWKYQAWEIGPNTMSIVTMKSLKDDSEEKKGAILATCR